MRLLWSREEAPLNSFEKEKYFEGCMPIEVMANEASNYVLWSYDPVTSSIQMTTKDPVMGVTDPLAW